MMESNTSKNSEDSVIIEDSPVKSKEVSESESSVKIISENSSIEKADEVKDEKITIEESGNEKVPKVEENSSKENKNEIVKNIKEKEDEIKKESTADQISPKSGNAISLEVAKSSEPAPDTKEVKRKRRTPSDQRDESPMVDSGTTKRLKDKNQNDNYCWRCHKDSVDARCSACPRSWHRKCMGGSPPASINENWICGECATILRAENAETRSEVVAHMSLDHLCMLLKYIVERMRNCQGSEPFWKAVDLTEVPNYMDYVVRPMDLNLLESNVRAKLYGSTDAFMADAKWIQHNCIVFNTCGGVYADTSKLTNAAKQIIKTAKQEVAEIEACPDCYARGRNLPRPHHMWFIEACRRPHPLIWAKLKGFPFWPAKAMPRVNGQGHIDVRFFGQHDRAWVAPKDVYLYSRDPPAPMPRKRKLEMAECIKEITRHCRKLEIAFGPFHFAPAKTPYIPNDPTQIKIMLPQYDPSRPSDFSPSFGISVNRKSPVRKRNSLLKRKLENDTSESIVESSTKESDISPQSEPVDQPENPKDVTNTQPTVTALPKPKKRLRKSINNGNSKNTVSQEKEASSPVQVKEAISSIEDSPVKVEPISNGSPEAETSPVIKVISQAKLKSEKTVQLEKSLAALLRKVNPKGRLSSPRNLNAKSPASQSTPNSAKLEGKTSLIKVYKPKARMVDKVNAEKALKSTQEKEQEKTRDSAPKAIEAKMINGILTPVTTVPVSGNTTSGTPSGAVSLLHTKRDSNIILSNSLLKMAGKKGQPRILVLNNGTLEPKQTSEDSKLKTGEAVTIRVKPESQVSSQLYVPAKKQSRARKSFPNKSPRLPQLLPKLPKPSASALDTMVYIPAQQNENGLDYQLPPPEAGPLSAQLNRSSNELAKRMAQLMEEAIKEAADTSSETGNGIDSHQATIHSLRLQIERMRWQHQQQLAELKHNTDRTLREMRASLEAERLRAVEDVRKEAALEKARCIEETKSKQWCSQCGREALFYCCWNTAYCDHVCQQAHWQVHQRKCAQKSSNASNPPGDSGNKQQKIIANVKSKSGERTIDVSSSGFQSPNVITKNLKIP